MSMDDKSNKKKIVFQSVIGVIGSILAIEVFQLAFQFVFLFILFILVDLLSPNPTLSGDILSQIVVFPDYNNTTSSLSVTCAMLAAAALVLHFFEVAAQRIISLSFFALSAICLISAIFGANSDIFLTLSVLFLVYGLLFTSAFGKTVYW